MIGRDDQLKNLNHYYQSEKNNLTILYGRHYTGKTALIKEFMQDKKGLYFNAIPGVSFEQIENFNRALLIQRPQYNKKYSYYEIFQEIFSDVSECEVLIIENFQNIVKADVEFMKAVSSFVSKGDLSRKVMIILTSPLVSWVENSMVKSIGQAAFSINTFMKLKELSYIHTVALFPESEVRETLVMYAVTGGIVGYMMQWKRTLSIKENICKLCLEESGKLYEEAEVFIKDEFREIGVYNTILGCLASGMNKLNEIHEYTGFGRDKISVYLKNLIEREIVEKIFSYDAGGSEHTRKGLYRIKDAYISFWYRFVYPYAGVRDIFSVEEFYDKYIEPDFHEFMLDAFIEIADEFLDIMNSMKRLNLQVEKKGSWHGKTGDIHLIYEDVNGKAIIGKAYVGKEPMPKDILDELQALCELAGVQGEYYYLFSTAGFTEELLSTQSDKINLIGIEEL